LAKVDFVVFYLWGGVPMNMYEMGDIDVTSVSLEYIRENLREVADQRHLEFLEYRYDEDFQVEGFVLHDNYAPVVDMLNPVTLTAYDQEGRLVLQNLLSPVFIGGFWVLSMGVIYYLTRKISS